MSHTPEPWHLPKGSTCMESKVSHYDHICSRERFAADIARHEMTILRDDGVYRHLRFKRPDSGAYYFDLVTWPGYLAITGDMGAGMFARTKDMFEFFRTDREHGSSDINPGYWAEKIQTDGRDAHSEWSVEKFNSIITDMLDRQLDDCDLDDDDREELREKVAGELLDPEDHYDAIERLRTWDDENFTIELCDFPSDREFTFHYIWRCRAIAWAIKLYDESKSALAAA